MNVQPIFDVGYRETRRVAIAGSTFFSDRTVPEGFPEHPVGILDVSTGGDYKRWPDAMKCGPAVPYVVSEKVVHDLLHAGISLEAGPVVLHCEVGPIVNPPKYFYLCAPIGVELEEVKVAAGSMISVRPETWNGADFCTTRDRRKLLYCSFRVLEMARKGKWTNFRFSLPAGIIEHIPDAVRDVDYLAPKKDWPPVWLKEFV